MLAPSPQWKTSDTPLDYEYSIDEMERRIPKIIDGSASELVWLLEHPPLYTAGTSADDKDLLNPNALPVFEAGRGGQYTYHGPGQRIAYVMLNLKERNAMDVRLYVANLEKWIIATLAQFGVVSFTREGRIGVWTIDQLGKEAKIAALGIRVRKWITYHGIAINVSPNLEHYQGIIPCGIEEYGVTSLQKLGVDITMQEVDESLQKEFSNFF